ncbi:MAG: BlaI/MecI/CopY family transcriptional regulator [Bdellovibrionota bacterium]
MTPRKKTDIEKPLTEVELELMHVIWELGDCTVKDVQTRLAEGRDLAYTSVATIMKILEQKGVLKSRKEDRAHTYHALISRTEYETTSLRHLADNLFHGDPSSMVMRLLSDTKLSKNELAAIRKLINERMSK